VGFLGGRGVFSDEDAEEQIKFAIIRIGKRMEYLKKFFIFPECGLSSV